MEIKFTYSVGRGLLRLHDQTVTIEIEGDTLIHQFCSVELTKEAILEFAEKFGELRTYKEVDVARENPKMGDSWSDWELELRECKLAYRLWRALKKNDDGSLKIAYSKYRESGGTPIDGGPFPNRISQKIAWRGIAETITGALHRNINSIESWVDLNRGGVGVNLVFEPSSLIALIWLQLAQAVTTSDRWKLCDFCGEPFKPNSMKGKYCSESHRQMAYHKRKQSKK